MTTMDHAVAVPQRRSGIAVPLILITAGTLFLLANTGYLVGLRWSDILRISPVILLVIGVDMLLRARSFALAVIVDVAIIAAAVAYLVVNATGITAAPLSQSTDVPRESATELAVAMSYGAGTLQVTGGATGLLSVRSTQDDIVNSIDRSGSTARVALSSGTNGRLGFDGRDRQWQVQLPSDMPTTVTMNGGAGDFDIDLSDVRLVRATLNGGASSFALRLPHPRGDVPIKISTGMASLDIAIPQGVAYRIRFSGFRGSTSGPTSTPDYATASDRFTIEITSPMSSVTIR